MIEPDDPDALRVGDREREHAATALHEAVGGGYIDLGEFEERSRAVYAAKTRRELRATLEDLPNAVGLFRPAGTLPATGAQATESVSVEWTTVKRSGRWEVPSRFMITGSMGTADLDLSQALLPPTGCVIEVMASWSTVKLRLGDAIVARTDDFAGGSMSTLKDKAGPPKVPGGPVVDIRGGPGWTTVVLRR